MIFVLFFVSFGSVFAKDNKIEVKFFYSPVCPHCAKEERFLDKIEKEYPVEIKRFSVFEKENVDILQELYKKYNVPKRYYGFVPFTLIGENFFIGFNEEIADKIKDCILNLEKNLCESKGEERASTLLNFEEKINIPLLGKIDLSRLSLSLLAVVLGTLDGFNVCSLGALVLILGLVLVLKKRKKILIFGGTFILTTAVVYGLLIVLWYKIFSLLVPYLKLMKLIIGLLGIGGGIYFLREFLKFRKKGAVCEMETGKKIISKFSSKIQTAFRESRNIFLVTGAVILFAGVITIVEFPCSAVVPVIFAGILTQYHLSVVSYILYMTLYLVFYMLDEIIVFLIAFFTMKLWLASNKALTWIVLAESIILFGLGFYYFFGF